MTTHSEEFFGPELRVPPVTVSLREVYRSLPALVGHRPRTGSQLRHHARIVDRRIRRVTTAPVTVAGLIDGVQARALLRYINRRPVTLEFAAAGCYRGGTRLDTICTRLVMSCSWLDEGRVRPHVDKMPLVVLDEVFPEDLEAVQAAVVDRMRRHVEHLAWTHAPCPTGSVLIIDGDLSRAPVDCDHLVGVVKQPGVQYWDEEGLPDLPHGHLGPILELPARRRDERTRFSSQLRLVPAGADAPWDLGLVRLEAFDPELLEPLAAACLAGAQNRQSGDPRWAVQIAPMRYAEESLKAMIPAYFTLPA
ncbi:MAG: hypothetical protein M0Z30_20315 [Actinomycetota bacterium]|nr:hypothetical protein [Actinomycetota bacterium]